MHIGRRFGFYGYNTPGLHQLRLGPLWLTWKSRDHHINLRWYGRVILLGNVWLSQEENHAMVKRRERRDG